MVSNVDFPSTRFVHHPVDSLSESPTDAQMNVQTDAPFTISPDTFSNLHSEESSDLFQSSPIRSSHSEKRRIRRESTFANRTNQLRMSALFSTLKESFQEALNQQFYGNIHLHFSVQDGIIQTMQSSVEKNIR